MELTEISVPGSIHYIDLCVFINNAGVLCLDSDTALALQIHGIHDTLTHFLDIAVHVSLAQYAIDKRGLPMVNVRNNSYISYIYLFCHRFSKYYLNIE